MAEAKPINSWLAAEVATEVARRLGWSDQVRQQFQDCCINGRMVSKKTDEQLKHDHLGSFPYADAAIKILSELKSAGASASSPACPSAAAAVAHPSSPAPVPPAVPLSFPASTPATTQGPGPTAAAAAAAASVSFAFSFDQIDRALGLKWKGSLVEENCMAKLPLEKMDDENPEERKENDDIFHGFMLSQRPEWQYPEGFVPRIANGSNIVAAAVHPRDVDDHTIIYDFIIRVCVYLTGMSMDYIEPFKSAALALPEETRRNIMIWSSADEENENANCVRKVFLNKEFLAALSPDQKKLCQEGYNSMKGYLKEYGFRGIFLRPEVEQNPWRRRVTLPLFDIGTDDADDDDKPHCGWLSTDRFITIFGRDYLHLQGAEVRLLPPWDRPVFNHSDFTRNFHGPPEHSLATECLDPAFRWLFRRSRDSERRSTVRAATLAVFWPPAPFQETPSPELLTEKMAEASVKETKLAEDHVINADTANPHIDRHTFGKSETDGILVINLRSRRSPPKPTTDCPTFEAGRMQDIARATVATAENETDHIVFSDEEKSAGKLYVCPKPFQRLSIPYALDGTNMIIASETGSGKTLVFLMAIFLNAFPQTQAACADVRPGIRAILIVPTGNRQLVQQHEDTFKRVVNHLRKAGDVFWKTAMLDDNRDIRTGRTLRRGVASSHYRPPAQKGSSRQSAHMHGRASGGGAAGDGGVVAAADENRDDRRDDFSQALIRIDTADRIKLGFRESPRMFQEVQVIAMDEVDKICGSQKDKDVVEELIKSCSHAQILSASATIVRHFEHRPDPATEWLKQDLFLTGFPNGLPRPLISIQTENVMPSSVFHLFLDLRKLRQGDHDRIQLAWEGLHVLKGTSVFPVPCMLFWNVAKSMKDHCQKLENSFADRQATKQKPELVELERNKPVVQKARDLENLRQGRSTGAIGNKCYATGMDYSFRSVTISHYAAEFLSSDYSWDTYTHTSGRCGRKPGELGMCVVFIRNERDFKHWDGVFLQLLSKQPTLCDQTGVLTFDAPIDEATTESYGQFWNHVRGHPICRPSPGPSFFIGSPTPHRDGINTVEKLWQVASKYSPRASWTSASAAAGGGGAVSGGSVAGGGSFPLPVAAQRAKPQAYMRVYFGSWHASFCEPVDAFIEEPSP